MIKNKDDGIVNINGCTIWKHAKIVRPYIIKHLKAKFPGSLILREFNKIDLVVLKEELPVEIQSAQMVKGKILSHAEFEDCIRRQLEDNIENYGRCWFFFDSEYYRYLNEYAKNVSMNLDWFTKYVKEDKLKVLTVRYDGLIKELCYEDLKFIRKLSNTCNIEYNDDERILNRNKITIMNNVLSGYKFTQEEIDRFIKEFDESDKSEITDCRTYLRSNKVDNRKRLYGDVLIAVTNLEGINKILDMKVDYTANSKQYGAYIGIFETVGIAAGSRTRFVDRFDICQYFPGYIRTKDKWNRIKDGHYTDSMLRELFTTYSLQMSGKQGSLFD
ncbi:MAG: hypothetical protein PHH36_14075 [Sideroxydans sp.]|nr:hypothetical protein [Sideroxydans sp.]